MNRRDALKYSTLIFGYAATGSAIAAIASGCKVEPQINWVPSFMSETESKAVSFMVDMILPKTETPGGLEVGVPEFLDGILHRVAGEKEKATFKEGMALLEANAQKEHSKSFNDLAAEEQVAFVTNLDKMAFGEQEGDMPADQKVWRKLKGDTYFAYFSSEKIGKEVLNYLPSPGPYEGCVDLSVSGGKLWTV